MAGLSLVTGATGFAGSHLLEHLVEREGTAAGWANPWGRRPPDEGPVTWQAVDLLDRSAVMQAIRTLRPSAIYHCAGIAHVGATWSDPARALQVNVLGTHHLLDAVRAVGLDCPILVTGSALVYRPSPEALSEDHPVGPDNPYGVSKLAQEMIARQAAGDLRTILVRPFNHAGPRQDEAYVTSSFARQIAEIEAGRREPVLHVGNLEARRDITDVRDTVRAYRMLLIHNKPGPYNVCRGEAYRVADLLDILVSLSRTTFRVQPDPARMRPSDNPIVLGTAARLTADTGWRPEIPIRKTLGDLLEGWRSRLPQIPA